MQHKKAKRKKTFSWRDIDITGGRSARTTNKASWLNRNKQAYFKPCELRAADPLRGLVLRLTSQTPAKIKHTRLSKQLLANAEHGKNNSHDERRVKHAGYRSHVPKHSTHSEREEREGETKRLNNTPTSLLSATQAHQSLLRPFICMCL